MGKYIALLVELLILVSTLSLTALPVYSNIYREYRKTTADYTTPQQPDQCTAYTCIDEPSRLYYNETFFPIAFEIGPLALDPDNDYDDMSNKISFNKLVLDDEDYNQEYGYEDMSQILNTIGWNLNINLNYDEPPSSGGGGGTPPPCPTCPLPLGMAYTTNSEDDLLESIKFIPYKVNITDGIYDDKFIGISITNYESMYHSSIILTYDLDTSSYGEFFLYKNVFVMLGIRLKELYGLHATLTVQITINNQLRRSKQYNLENIDNNMYGKWIPLSLYIDTSDLGPYTYLVYDVKITINLTMAGYDLSNNRLLLDLDVGGLGIVFIYPEDQLMIVLFSNETWTKDRISTDLEEINSGDNVIFNNIRIAFQQFDSVDVAIILGHVYYYFYIFPPYIGNFGGMTNSDALWCITVVQAYPKLNYIFKDEEWLIIENIPYDEIKRVYYTYSLFSVSENYVPLEEIGGYKYYRLIYGIELPSIYRIMSKYVATNDDYVGVHPGGFEVFNDPSMAKQILPDKNLFGKIIYPRDYSLEVNVEEEGISLSDILSFTGTVLSAIALFLPGGQIFSLSYILSAAGTGLSIAALVLDYQEGLNEENVVFSMTELDKTEGIRKLVQYGVEYDLPDGDLSNVVWDRAKCATIWGDQILYWEASNPDLADTKTILMLVKNIDGDDITTVPGRFMTMQRVGGRVDSLDDLGYYIADYNIHITYKAYITVYFNKYTSSMYYPTQFKGAPLILEPLLIEIDIKGPIVIIYNP